MHGGSSFEMKYTILAENQQNKVVLISLAAILVIAYIVFLVIKQNRDKRNKLIKKLKDNYGKFPKLEFTVERFKSLGFYFRSLKPLNTDIDEITVNDIDLDEVFLDINNTCSSIGEEYLYSIIRKPVSDKETLEERERIIDFFSKDADTRLKIQILLSNIGKIKSISLYEYLSRLDSAPVTGNLLHYILLLCYPVFILVAIFGNVVTGVLFLILTVIVSVITYYSCKAKTEQYYNILLIMLGTIRQSDKICKIDSEELKPYLEKLEKATEVLRPMNRFSFIITSRGGNLVDILLDYVRILTHLDLIKFNKIIAKYNRHNDKLLTVFEIIGFLDSMIAISSYRRCLPYYGIPNLSEDKNFKSFSVEDLYHPLLENAVPNSISTEKSVLLTGSNASGKSTFIKSLTINAILSQTIHTCVAKSYSAPFFRIVSSMALRDNLSGNESYYIVEIKSLKRILDSVSEEIPVLCFVDEVLRGTNTLERIAASSQILRNLSKENCLCFAATHDLELADILSETFDSYHFSEKLTEKDVEFDYLLKEGKATSRNAIKLLRTLGYPEEITNNAELYAAEFEKTGVWGGIN